MNPHQRREAKRVRRRKRVRGETRHKRDEVARAMDRVALMREGERKLLAVGLEIRKQLEQRGVRVKAKRRAAA